MNWILEESFEFALLVAAAASFLMIRSRWRPSTEGHAPIRAAAASPWPVTFERRTGGPWSSTPGASIDGWPAQVRTKAARRELDDRTAVVVALRIDGLDDKPPEVGGRIRRAAAASIGGVSPGAILVDENDSGMFRVLLADADENSARTYITLVTRPLARWLEDPGSPIRLTAGWAATSPHRDLGATDRLAEARLAGASAGWIRSASTWRSAPPHA